MHTYQAIPSNKIKRTLVRAPLGEEALYTSTPELISVHDAVAAKPWLLKYVGENEGRYDSLPDMARLNKAFCDELIKQSPLLRKPILATLLKADTETKRLVSKIADLNNVSISSFYLVNLELGLIHFQQVPYTLQDDKPFCMRLMEFQPEAFEFFSYALRDDTDIVEVMFFGVTDKSLAYLYKFISSRLRKLKWIQTLGLMWTIYVYAHFTPAQRRNEQFAKELFVRDSYFYPWIPVHLREMESYFIKAIKDGAITPQQIRQDNLAPDLIKRLGNTDIMNVVLHHDLQSSCTEKKYIKAPKLKI